MPSPRKLSEVSLMIMTGMASVLAAMMWLVNAGTMWRVMMRKRLHPASSAARTKSSSRSDRKRPRTSRASVVQPMKARMMVMAKKTCSGRQSCGRAAVITSQIGIVGQRLQQLDRRAG